MSVDTCSGVVSANPLRGENVKNVISHCLRSFACWGVPKQLKTNNAPAYTSKSFSNFLACYDIHHVTGIPYNPRGQGVIERTHLTFKTTLQKIQKGGIGEEHHTPTDLTNLTTFILNFLTLDKDGVSAAERHWGQQKTQQSMVKWKDVLTGSWKGPEPVLRWHRGSLCVFPQDAPVPLWVPERLTRLVAVEPVEDAATADDSDDDHPAACPRGPGTDPTAAEAEDHQASTPSSNDSV